jgi:hypothetical protein
MIIKNLNFRNNKTISSANVKKIRSQRRSNALPKMRIRKNNPNKKGISERYWASCLNHL